MIYFFAILSFVFFAIALVEGYGLLDQYKKICDLKDQLYDMSGLEPVFYDDAIWSYDDEET